MIPTSPDQVSILLLTKLSFSDPLHLAFEYVLRYSIFTFTNSFSQDLHRSPLRRWSSSPHLTNSYSIPFSSPHQPIPVYFLSNLLIPIVLSSHPSSFFPSFPSFPSSNCPLPLHSFCRLSGTNLGIVHYRPSYRHPVPQFCSRKRNWQFHFPRARGCSRSWDHCPADCKRGWIYR